MRILVEPSDYRIHNMGDKAMLMVALSRIAALWPTATLDVVADESRVLRSIFHSVDLVSVGGQNLWLSDDFLPDRALSLAERLFKGKQIVRQAPGWIRAREPSLVELFWRRKLRNRPNATRELHNFTNAVARADLLVVAGMGGITDAFPDFARGILEVMSLAIRRGKPVAMMGQGMGPLADPALLKRAAAILPKLDLIALREGLTGVPLLQHLGVPNDRVRVTGDDAIELAYPLRGESLAGGLGVNVRLSDYSGLDREQIGPLRSVLQEAASARAAPLVAVPISTLPQERDADAIEQLLGGYSNTIAPERQVADPSDVIALVNRCRVVVTGSYHAGVFALSCGIPAIGLARSAYYQGKFKGLADQFGPGCEVVDLADPACWELLRNSIDRLWDGADRLRPALLDAAARQIAAGRDAYGELRRLVAHAEGQS
jgi:polysaccharide pyruvyl transferase WcaK-like protein